MNLSFLFSTLSKYIQKTPFSYYLKTSSKKSFNKNLTISESKIRN